VAPPANTINRQEVAERSNQSSNDDKRVPVGTNTSPPADRTAQHRLPRLNVCLDDLHGEGQSLEHVVDELDRGFLVAAWVDT
jgi:hypothetical protein